MRDSDRPSMRRSTCVISIDEHGHVAYFNKSAERTFGYPASEAVGEELAEVIVPASWRDVHRRRLAQDLRTGEASILGRRRELTAMRAVGSEFPVELWRSREPAGVDLALLDADEGMA